MSDKSRRRSRSANARKPRRHGNFETFEPRQLMAVVSVDNLDTTPDNADCGSNQNPCNSIQQGINRANAGDDVVLASRTFDENFVINKSLRITSGEEPAKLRSSHGAVITVESNQPATHVVLENLDITGADIGVAAFGNVDLHLVGASVSEHLEAGLLFEGQGQLRIESSQFVSNGGEGIAVAGNANVQLVDIQVVANGSHGLAIEGAQNVDVQGAIVHDNVGNGIQVHGASGLVVVATEASGNRLNGIEVAAHNGALQLVDVATEFNASNGLQIVDQQGPTSLQRMQVSGNDSGGLVVENAIGPVQIDGGHFADNRLNDIAIRHTPQVIIAGVPGMQDASYDTTQTGDILFESDFLGPLAFVSAAGLADQLALFDQQIADAEGKIQKANEDTAVANAELAGIKMDDVAAKSDLDGANIDAGDANAIAQEQRELQAKHQGKADSGAEQDGNLADQYEDENSAEIDAAREAYDRATRRLKEILDTLDNLQRELDGTNDPEQQRILRGALKAGEQVLEDRKAEQHAANDAYLEKNPQGPGSDGTKADRQRGTEGERATDAERRAVAAERQRAAAQARAKAARERIERNKEARQQAQQRKADAAKRRAQAQRDKAAAEKAKQEAKQADEERRRADRARQNRERIQRGRALRDFQHFHRSKKLDVTVFKDKEDITLKDIQARIGRQLLDSNDPVLEKIGFDFTIEEAKQTISQLNGLAVRSALIGVKMFVSRGLALGLAGPVGGFVLERLVTSMLATDPNQIEIGSFPMETGSFVGRGRIMFNRETCEYLLRIDMYFPSWGNNTPDGVFTDRAYTVLIGGKASSAHDRNHTAAKANDTPKTAELADSSVSFDGPLVGDTLAKAIVQRGDSTDNVVMQFSEPVVGLRTSDFAVVDPQGTAHRLTDEAWLETTDGQSYTLRGLDHVMQQPGAYQLQLDAIDAAITTETGYDFVQEVDVDLKRIAGDSTADGRFDASDLIAIFQAGKYRSDEAATFAEGDWNADGLFDESDLIAALKLGHFRAV